MTRVKKAFYVVGTALLLISCGKTRNCQCTSTDKISGESKVTYQPIGSVGGLSSDKKKQSEQCTSQNYSDSNQERTCKLID
ncbi:MAG: hypothetical protein ABI207_03880 [Crocinitomicaceae bacterium]